MAAAPEQGSTLAIEAREYGDEGWWVVLVMDLPPSERAPDGERATSRVPANIARKIAGRLLDEADAADERNGGDEAPA